jgi:hypothetical protein
MPGALHLHRLQARGGGVGSDHLLPQPSVYEAQ